MTAEATGLTKAIDDMIAVGRAEGIEVNGPLGRWLDGQAKALRALGDVIDTQNARTDGLLAGIATAANAEVAKTRAATEQARVALRQAQEAHAVTKAEREGAIKAMISETTPDFVKELRGALVLREQAWNEGVKRRRFFVASGVTLALFLCGYGLRAWSDMAAVGTLQACLARPLVDDGHVYCDVTSMQEPRR